MRLPILDDLLAGPPARVGFGASTDGERTLAARVHILGNDTTGYYAEVTWPDKASTLEGPYDSLQGAKDAALMYLGTIAWVEV